MRGVTAAGTARVPARVTRAISKEDRPPRAAILPQPFGPPGRLTC